MISMAKTIAMLKTICFRAASTLVQGDAEEPGYSRSLEIEEHVPTPRPLMVESCLRVVPVGNRVLAKPRAHGIE